MGGQPFARDWWHDGPVVTPHPGGQPMAIPLLTGIPAVPPRTWGSTLTRCPHPSIEMGNPTNVGVNRGRLYPSPSASRRPRKYGGSTRREWERICGYCADPGSTGVNQQLEPSPIKGSGRPRKHGGVTGLQRVQGRRSSAGPHPRGQPSIPFSFKHV